MHGDNMDYLAGVYQTPPPDVTGRDVFLVDFSYKRAVVAEMLTQAASVTLIDHHKSALEDLAGLEGLRQYTDLNRSGARLAWDFLFPGEPCPRLLAHVEDRDLWRFRLPYTREIQAALFSYEYGFEIWSRLMQTTADDSRALMHMVDEGTAIERKHHKDIAELVAVCKRRMMIGGYSVPVASLPYTMVSDAAQLMAQGEPFAACYWDTEDGRIFGLRSTEQGRDVSEIAKHYGGGGHRNSAGFKVRRTHILATC
jgi:oligoribonuclease NrnB/cAMP/cGMP phosphodiesterase (DHH superfamily)